MKTYIFPIAFFLFIAMGTSIGWLVMNLKYSRAEIARQTENFNQRGDSISTLSYTVGELKTEIATGDARYKTADSLLKAKNIYIGQLERMRTTEVTIDNKDTVPLTNVDTLSVRQKANVQLIKTPFRDARNCITIEGFVLSTDSFPSVAITSQHAVIETYDLDVHRRWYQFWKPRTWKETYTKCGNLRVLDVGVGKKK